MICLACEKKIKGIKEDSEYTEWNRKFHKNCWRDRNIYFNLYLRMLKLENANPKILKIYKNKSCLC